MTRSLRNLISIVLAISCVGVASRSQAQFDPVSDSIKKTAPPAKKTPSHKPAARPRPRPHPTTRKPVHKVVHASTQDFGDLMARAWAAIDAKDTNKASSLLKQAAFIKPNSSAVPDAQSLVLLMQGNTDAASDKASFAIESGNPCKAAHYVKAMVYRQKGANDLAISEMKAHISTPGAYAVSKADGLLAAWTKPAVDTATLTLFPVADDTGKVLNAKVAISSDAGPLVATSEDANRAIFSGVPVGAHIKISFTADGYQLTSPETYEVPAGGLEIRPTVKALNATTPSIAANMGKLIAGQPSLADVKITVGDRTVDSGTTLDLPKGDYTVKVTCGEYVREVPVTIQAGQTLTLPIGLLDFQPTSGVGKLHIETPDGSSHTLEITGVDKTGVKIPMRPTSYTLRFETPDGYVEKPFNILDGQVTTLRIDPPGPIETALTVVTAEHLKGHFRLEVQLDRSGFLMAFIESRKDGVTLVKPSFPNRYQQNTNVTAGQMLAIPPPGTEDENGQLILADPGDYVFVLTDQKLDGRKYVDQKIPVDQLLKGIRADAQAAGIHVLEVFTGRLK